MKKKQNLVQFRLTITFLLFTICNTINAQWKYESVKNIKDDVIIFYDVVYEKELTEKQKKSTSFIKELVITFNKNKLLEKRLGENLNLSKYLLLDYSEEKAYSYSDYSKRKKAVIKDFKLPTRDVTFHEGKKKEILGFSCQLSTVNRKGKNYNIYTTKELGLRYVQFFNTEGFMLEFPGYSKSLGAYTVTARRIAYSKVPNSIYSLDDYKIITPEENKKELKKIKEKKIIKAETDHRRIGTNAPKFSFRTMKGDKIKSNSLKNKATVLYFWFTKGKWSKKQIPELNTLKKKFKNKDVAFIAIALDKEYKLDSFLKFNEFNYQLVEDGRWLAEKFEVKSFPSHVIIDEKGIIQFYKSGYNTELIEEMSYKISKILSK
ncbi:MULTISPECIES: peroxiredoxin family protein [Tenacibaculum]|uniref:peroxiredoxin family protein n=1 Tax=Tenacibaculum TaxID=104267 RepID=UPI001F0AEA27|nr:MULTISPECIES: TlpA disulfide reductase family protein [Tenacibaculum]MCH3881329.1 TlpA family protein disulfide reductase [Tenacibaculum aquimarinum]MDO6599077.1 TlpA disulfide reductase family protein [Tenacibaculum sp. 1_MG-2023]